MVKKKQSVCALTTIRMDLLPAILEQQKSKVPYDLLVRSIIRRVVLGVAGLSGRPIPDGHYIVLSIQPYDIWAIWEGELCACSSSAVCRRNILYCVRGRARRRAHLVNP